MRKLCGLLVTLSIAILANAQTHYVAVHAGHLLDVKSGKTLSDQTILIESGKIVSVSTTAEAKIPPTPCESTCRMQPSCPD